ncbi:hypothetical protein CQA49_07230 [Helicobacter sp. MIT 00-7814]|uniref:hypothetical protein n=1 Tax=unclassified Helicobacter TaxID=2593540 RepID=UPI000E1EADF3|nr:MULTISPECIES: hypothetical protein [unclassified Helicobacter]RDU52702.1 hypothetical protein CQA37_08210 [Helicobacter sp. MIT 99-10781]RDU53136.1 hypothetical protein CQA49_07230 [Helicobacter sp. MIT 00-7814]
MSKAPDVTTTTKYPPSQVFAAILLHFGVNPKAMWKRNGVYGCGRSGFRFYPNDYTFSFSELRSRYVGGRYEKELEDRFFKVSIDEIQKKVSWQEIALVA